MIIELFARLVVKTFDKKRLDCTKKWTDGVITIPVLLEDADFSKSRRG